MTFNFYALQGNNEEKENLLALPLMKRVERLLRPRTASGAVGGVIETYGHTSKYDNAKRKIKSAKTERRSPFHERQTSPKLSTPRTPSSISNTTTEVRIGGFLLLQTLYRNFIFWYLKMYYNFMQIHGLI